MTSGSTVDVSYSGDAPSWRLIPLLQSSGVTHMAIDEWLLDQHRVGRMPSVLRFYTWSPPAISLGYHQRQGLEHWQHLTWQGRRVEQVRRPSGGRAVLHQGDLTYAVVTSNLAGNRTQVYQTLCQFLIEGWRSLGVELQYGHAGRGYIHNPNCFGTATAADLVLPNGTKLIGSAQLRRGNAILQHGSIRLSPDPLLVQQVFGAEPGRLDLPLASSELLIQTVVEALINAAQRCFNVRLVSQPLTEQEWTEIKMTQDRWQVT